MLDYLIETPLKIGTYGVMMAIGFLTASWILNRDLQRRGIDTKVGDAIVMFAIVMGVLGSKLAYMLTEADEFVWGDLISGAGLTWHGGLILAASTIVGYFIYKKLPVVVMLDAVAPMLASGYAFGRIGCLISGDGCYGIPCQADSFDKLLCMAFPNGIVRIDIPVHPTPLYESVANFMLFGALWAMRKRIRRPGILFVIYLAVSGFLRFAVEFIRRPDGRPDRWLDLRDAQWIGIGQVVLALVILAFFMWRSIPKDQEFGILPIKADPRTQRRGKHN